MKVLYFDCFSGISGDMTLAALMGLGIEREYLISELRKLSLPEWELSIKPVLKNGLSANYVEITTKDHTHRKYLDIKKIITDSTISEEAKQLSLGIFERVATAEAKIHNKPKEEVTFHEVGAVDSIIDIVGVSICIEKLSPERVVVSTVNDGKGFIGCHHGLIPTPAPAVLEILAQSNIQINQIDIESELVTPTGAAIIAQLASKSDLMPKMKILNTSYGAGKRDLKIPNVLRVVEGEDSPKEEEFGESSEWVTVMETNIDDTSPEILGYVMERLFTEGAYDVFFTNIYMKKNRPATKLTVLCSQQNRVQMQKIIFSETSTIGIRFRHELRHCLNRRMKTVKTVYGDVLVKLCSFDGDDKISVEYEEAKSLAAKLKIPIKKIYESVITGE